MSSAATIEQFFGHSKRLILIYLFTILEQMIKRDQLDSFELMLILVLIRLAENTHGVQICEELEKLTSRDIPIGSVYAAMKWLEDKAFYVTVRRLKEVRETQRSLVKVGQGLA